MEAETMLIQAWELQQSLVRGNQDNVWLPCEWLSQFGSVNWWNRVWVCNLFILGSTMYVQKCECGSVGGLCKYWWDSMLGYAGMLH